MAFNTVCAMLLVLLGSPVRIYIISNGGYLLACAMAFGGYFVFRHWSPDTPRPFRLPTIAKWGALVVFVLWMVIYFFGGWNSPKVVVGPTQGPGLYLLGLFIVALYAPLYWWRAWQDRKLAARGDGPGGNAAAMALSANGDGASGADVLATRDSLAASEAPGEAPRQG
jgi:amino acid transporter